MKNDSESKPKIYQPKLSGPGRTPNDLVARLVTKYRNEKTKKNSWRCVAPKCDMVRQGNAQLDRVLKHATTCKDLQVHDVDLWREAITASGQSSLGAKLEEEPVAAPEKVSTGIEPEGSRADKPPLKKIKSQTILDVDQLRDVGKKKKEEQLRLYKDRVDHVIMRLICVRGLVPSIIDSPEWRELMGLLNNMYHPTSADAFADKHIPREAVYVREKQIERLRTINNLTLTFDGNTTRKPQSIYTVHATTPSRESYFLDTHEGSDERHTTEWVKDKLLKVYFVLFLLYHSHFVL
jgi:hypothetical protein